MLPTQNKKGKLCLSENFATLNHIMLKQTDHCVFINLNHGKQNRGKNYLQEI